MLHFLGWTFDLLRDSAYESDMLEGKLTVPSGQSYAMIKGYHNSLKYELITPW